MNRIEKKLIKLKKQLQSEMHGLFFGELAEDLKKANLSMASIKEYIEAAEFYKRVTGLTPPLLEEKENHSWNEPCPDCGKRLVHGHGGGVECPDKKNCGYWFCF